MNHDIPEVLNVANVYWLWICEQDCEKELLKGNVNFSVCILSRKRSSHCGHNMYICCHSLLIDRVTILFCPKMYNFMGYCNIIC